MAEGDAGKAEAGSCSGAGAGGGCDAVKKRPEQSVAFHELFGFADPLDWLLMAAGSAGAVVHGAAMPVFFLLFGELVNGFGKNQHNLRRMTDEVSKACIPFLAPFFFFCCFSLPAAAMVIDADAQACAYSIRSTSSTSASSSAPRPT
jgi:ATP-binding cassette subfamily B (MDR/TAP) protein 1